MDLFSLNSENTQTRPLAERLRPKSFSEFVGQKKITSDSSAIFTNLAKNGFIPNLILWGPPGTGKTTFAHLLSQKVKAQFVSCNAVDTGAKDLREIGMRAGERKRVYNESTLLFIDEIHRLNKSQQDVLLPFTEKGDLTLIGATTENPSYELNSALLSRARVLVFEPLSSADLAQILTQAAQTAHVSLPEVFEPVVQDGLIQSVSGDARKLLNIFEIVLTLFQQWKMKLNSTVAIESAESSDLKFPLNEETFQSLHLTENIRFDKNGSEHYDVISAFIKSVRGSNPDAAVYYLARMLEGGEDPVFIARRLVISASEDIGNADPRALPLAVAGLQAVELVGMPEARICLSQVTTYLASAPKSNRAYLAINEASEYVQKTGALPIPLSLRSAQTRLSKELGYGKNYLYSHDYPRGYAEQQFLPDLAKDKKFYEPSTHGFEKTMNDYLNWLKSGKNN